MQHMDTLRLNVRQRGKGYVAQSATPETTAMGSSPEEAAERARLMALAHFGKSSRPTMLIVYLDEPGTRTIVMQPIDRAFALVAVAEENEWRYMASVSTATAPPEAAGE
jgi:hypothetical protein